MIPARLPTPIPVGRVIIKGREYPAGHIPKKRRIPLQKEPNVSNVAHQKHAQTMRSSATFRKKDAGATK